MKSDLRIGLDGCRGGWLAADIHGGVLELFPSLESLRQAWGRSIAKALIDIPIGLPETEYRRCDIQGRALLGKRCSTLFLVPCRSAVYAPDYRAANEENRRCLGRGLSIQAWNLCPKIRETDSFLQMYHSSDVFLESHPELCFARYRGQPLDSKKKTESGFQERLNILEEAVPGWRQRLDRKDFPFRRWQVKPDDIVDALVLSLAAAGPTVSVLETMPQDAAGLPMQLQLPPG